MEKNSNGTVEKDMSVEELVNEAEKFKDIEKSAKKPGSIKPIHLWGEDYVDVRNHPSFSVAIDSIGSKEKSLLIPNEQILKNNKEIPRNIDLHFLKGGSLSIDAEKTLVISGTIDPGIYSKFKGAGDVNFSTQSVPIVYPQWFGAKGDGINDDTYAIQAAINSIEDCGGIVYLIVGTYLISSSLIIPSQFISIVGSARGKTVLKCLPTLSDFVIKMLGTSGSRKGRCNLSNFWIDGDNQGSPLGGIRMEHSVLVRIDNILVHKMANASAIGFYAKNCFNLVFYQCQGYLGVEGTPQGEAGFKFYNDEESGTNIILIDCLSQNCGIGYYFPDCPDTGWFYFPMFIGCAASSNNTSGFEIGNEVRGLILEQCHIESAHSGGVPYTDYGVKLNPATFNRTKNIIIKNCDFNQVTTAIYARNLNGLIIDNNNFHGSVVAGAGTVLDIDTSNIKVKYLNSNDVISGTFYSTFAADCDPRETKVRAYLSSDQDNLVDNTWTKIGLNAETFDSKGEFDKDVNYRFTAKRDCKVRAKLAVMFNDCGASKQYSIKVRKNGATDLTEVTIPSSDFEDYLSLQLDDEYELSQDDYLEAYARSNKGDNTADITGGPTKTYMVIVSADEE